MTLKEFFTLCGLLLTLVAFVPYLRDILRNRIRPHVFSWVIWGLTTFVTFLAQLSAGAAPGAWPIGLSGLLTIAVAVLAYIKRADLRITRLDWVFFLAALSALPLWFFTADPTTAVIVLTAVDMLGFGPTFRKVWQQPHTESIPFYLLFLVRSLLVVLAVSEFSVATVLFPAAVALACTLVIVLILLRRRCTPPPTA